MKETIVRYAAMLAFFGAFPWAYAAQPPADEPETVMITFHAKPGSESELARAIAQHWATARAMKLLAESPHLTLQGREKGKTYFIDIFTWRNAHIPDAAPLEIRKIWSEMNALVESREGHPGLELDTVSVVAPQPR